MSGASDVTGEQWSEAAEVLRQHADELDVLAKSPAPKKKKASGPSPTQRSLKLLREDGYRVAIVEHWNVFARIRQDLFGCIDLLALKDGVTLAVQTTTSDHYAERVKKVQAAEAYDDMIKAGWTIVVHGWVKRANGRWECRIENC